MNIFTELESIIEGRTDDELIPLSVANIKRMVTSARAMNEKASIVRAHYMSLYGMSTEDLEKEVAEMHQITKAMI